MRTCSSRIPAALNGIVGFRPTGGRDPSAGVTRISSTRDTIGPMARTVGDVAVLDQTFSNSVIENWSAFTAKIGLAYLPNDNASIYGAVFWGFKNGGFAAATQGIEFTEPLDQEEAPNDEFGDTNIPGTAFPDQSGQNLIRAPEHKFNVDVDYILPLANGSELAVTPSWRYTYDQRGELEPWAVQPEYCSKVLLSNATA